MRKSRFLALFVAAPLMAPNAAGAGRLTVAIFDRTISLADSCVLLALRSLGDDAVTFNCEAEGSNYVAEVTISTPDRCIEGYRDKIEPGFRAQKLSQYSENGLTHVQWKLLFGAGGKTLFARASWSEKECLSGMSSQQEVLNGLSTLWR